MSRATMVQQDALHLPTIPPMPPPVVPPMEMAVGPGMIYVSKAPVWEYKQIVRQLAKEKLLSEEELNQLGAEGWELTGVVATAEIAFFYLKRSVD